jgi:hypothetical protein
VSRIIALVGVPIVIFVICLCGGAVAASHWLPDLETGPVGGIAFFAVCGLLGLALALLSQHVYLIVNEVEHLGSVPGGLSKGEVVAGGLRNIAAEEGTVLGLAIVVYLLAPRVGKRKPLAEPVSQEP